MYSKIFKSICYWSWNVSHHYLVPNIASTFLLLVHFTNVLGGTIFEKISECLARGNVPFSETFVIQGVDIGTRGTLDFDSGTITTILELFSGRIKKGGKNIGSSL
jgi:hypothetical protein